MFFSRQKCVMLLLTIMLIVRAHAADPVVDVSTRGVIGDGQTKVADGLRSIIAGALPGQTVFFPKGKYVAEPGTVLYIDKALKFRGDSAELVNMRLFFLADVDLDGLSLTEVDCIHRQQNPSFCPAAGAMITAGYIGFPLTRVSIRNVEIATTRAYTAIEFGYDQVAGATIDHFSIVDHEMSAISIYGGEHIRITNGSIQGGPDAVVDDGIALSPLYGPISDVAISHVRAVQSADLVGIGSDLYWPLTNVSVDHSSCERTVVCLYFRLGDSSPAPAPYNRYSYVDGVKIDTVSDTDPQGERYHSSIMLVARGGSVGRNITISNLTANSRAASPYGFRVQAFLDGGSQLQNVILQNCAYDDSLAGAPNGPDAPGYIALEGVFLQTDGDSLIDGLKIGAMHLAATAYWGIDAGSARIANLQITNPDFQNIFLNLPNWTGTAFYLPNLVASGQ